MWDTPPAPPADQVGGDSLDRQYVRGDTLNQDPNALGARLLALYLAKAEPVWVLEHGP